METDNLDNLLSQYKNSDPRVSLDETKAHFLRESSKLHGGASAGHGFNLLKLLIMISTLGAIALIISQFILNQPTKPAQEQVAETIRTELSNTPSPLVDTINNVLEEEALVPVEPSITQASESKPVVQPAPPKIATVAAPKRGVNRAYFPPLFRGPKQSIADSSTNLPTLSEEQKKATLKQKAKMLKALRKKDKSTYRELPLIGHREIREGYYSQYLYYIQSTEVSVLEYRTFLYDLLMQGQKERYLLAKPNEKAWKQLDQDFGTKVAEHYFSDPAYDDFPMNCISREAAQLYCTWLNEELNKWKVAKGKTNNPNFKWILRLPTEQEWTAAASGGNGMLLYPWGGPYMRNSRGMFLANFRPNEENYDDDGAILTAEVKSYFPNDFGLYCMSGNVAEMVTYDDENQTPGTKGGSWSSVSQELQINGNDRFKGIVSPSVDIGFRPVIYLEIMADGLERLETEQGFKVED